MAYTNNAVLIRRELLTRISKLLFEGNLENEVDRIPVEMRPKSFEEVSRCCIYKDRAMIKYKIMALLGFSISEEKDELTSLAEYSRMALARPEIDQKVLTIVREVCTSCIQSSYMVTNLCRGCVGRPCMLNCPKNAIDLHHGQAEIDQSACVNCGLCKKVCPFHAIIYVPVPCKEACPVNAITREDHGRTNIDYSKCIYCGKCMTACPFGAIMGKSQITEIYKALKSEKEVYAVVAPAIMGQYKASFANILGAVKQVGFDGVYEAALGADITIEHEAAEFKERMDREESFMTTSCCPSYVKLVEKHLPELTDYVSKAHSPMHYTAAHIKKEHPESVVVFVGPCLAKGYEAKQDPYVDYVMNFEEIHAFMAAKGITVNSAEKLEWDTNITNAGRGFAVSGGVAGALKKYVNGAMVINDVAVNGISVENIRMLKSFAKGQCEGNFVEVMACEGGCVAGPAILGNPKTATRQIKDFCK
ncbi:MAG: monomeric [FeFe] hydrogenase [Bacteroidota bacterium]|nr:monomeric [FeFe] hydrogenase [Bacteroidota bacterium]